MTKIYYFHVGFNKLLIDGREKWNKFHSKGEGVVNGIDFFFSHKNWNKEVSYRIYQNFNSKFLYKINVYKYCLK